MSSRQDDHVSPSLDGAISAAVDLPCPQEFHLRAGGDDLEIDGGVLIGAVPSHGHLDGFVVPEVAAILGANGKR